jgi:hypothetical protein
MGIIYTDLQSMSALEDNVRSKVLHEEANLPDDASIPSGDVVSLQKAMREMRARYEVRATHSYLARCYLMLSLDNRLTSNSYGSA